MRVAAEVFGRPEVLVRRQRTAPSFLRASKNGCATCTAVWLTGLAGTIKLERLSRGCFSRQMSRDSFCSSLGWEVVQLVGLQTLTLAILVRVQASQPNFFSKSAAVVFLRFKPLPIFERDLTRRNFLVLRNSPASRPDRQHQHSRQAQISHEKKQPRAKRVCFVNEVTHNHRAKEPSQIAH